jgi:hypothetical protein
MTVRTYTQKDGAVWEWTETVESAKALEIYYKLVSENARKRTN